MSSDLVTAGVAVLAGIDGSEEAVLALSRAVALLGDRIGRLGLVSVVTYDSVEDGHEFQNAEAAARLWMAAARRAVPGLDPEEYVLPGRPAQALARMATTEGFDLLVVGSRGRGMSQRIFGSVARELAGTSPLPLLLGGRPAVQDGLKMVDMTQAEPDFDVTEADALAADGG